MTPTDFKAYLDPLIRLILVIAGIAIAFYALHLSYGLADKSLFTSLASGVGVTVLLKLYEYWYGASHKSPPPPDTTVTSVTKTPEVGQ